LPSPLSLPIALAALKGVAPPEQINRAGGRGQRRAGKLELRQILAGRSLIVNSPLSSVPVMRLNGVPEEASIIELRLNPKGSVRKRPVKNESAGQPRVDVARAELVDYSRVNVRESPGQIFRQLGLKRAPAADVKTTPNVTASSFMSARGGTRHEAARSARVAGVKRKGFSRTAIVWLVSGGRYF